MDSASVRVVEAAHHVAGRVDAVDGARGGAGHFHSVIGYALKVEGSLGSMPKA